jgi:hypothetical protein
MRQSLFRSDTKSGFYAIEGIDPRQEHNRTFIAAGQSFKRR